MGRDVGGDFYRGLELPFSVDLADDQRRAGLLAAFAGLLPVVVLVVVRTRSASASPSR